MNTASPTSPAELTPLLELTTRIGRNPLLTQGSTGNTSAKLGGVLWIKASGKWMADVTDPGLLIPLDLARVTECLSRNLDPVDRFPGASLETATHAVIPHRWCETLPEGTQKAPFVSCNSFRWTADRSPRYVSASRHGASLTVSS